MIFAESFEWVMVNKGLMSFALREHDQGENVTA